MASAFYPRHTNDEGVVSSPNLPEVEKQILDYWAQDGTFQASVDQRPAGERGENEYVFYDGPPFANGLPHYGHLLTGYVKDVIPRFRTMIGQKVERRFGWDTHGLPAELEAERILGITGKAEIEQMGIAAFNDACRESVLKYTKEWEDYVTRQARWVDFENDYKTLDLSYMESVIWAFKQLYDKGLAYEGYRVLPYCWRDETPLSNHELRMDDDVYQMRQDPSVTVGLRLESGELLLIWTTTPWTLPSNLAVAVGPDIDYVVVEPSVGEFAGEQVLLAKARLEAYGRELGAEDDAPTLIRELKGSQLAGLTYTPPFPYFAGQENAHQVLVDEFVTTDDGTGIVHMAPAFGEEDMEVCQRVGIEAVVPVDAAGRFTNEVPDYAGQQVFEANRAITRDLRDATGALAGVDASQRARLVRHETYDHSYPHCWRCRNPLIYKAVSSWFVRVTDIKDRMVELNEDITWVPEHIKHGQFGKWLENARDWSISRNRYWGTPIPVWVSDNPEYPRIDVYGSIAELEEAFGVEVTDLHRPYIDELVRPNPDDPTGKSMMRRIPDVLDVWFDSGAMPFAQVHYPFENQEWFTHHFPGDFIVEYIGQTRGWFYTLHILATALFDRPAFRTCVSHGIVLGNDGRKASKSLRNYPDPGEMWDTYGSDAVRLTLMSSPVLRGGNLIVAEEAIREQVRGVLLPLWNTYYFFSLYANSVGGGSKGGARGFEAQMVEPHEVSSLPVMDRYILARTRDLACGVRTDMENYDVPAAAARVREHMDVLTNWYVRTSRNRFWEEDEAAYNTLYTALEVLCRVMAPLAPMITEEVWRGLTGQRSVHLSDWPVLDSAYADDALVTTMDAVREVVSAAHGLRKAHQMRVRQPLRKLRVAVDNPQAMEPFTALIAEEVNLLEVELLNLANVSATDYGVHDKLTVNARVAGPRLGKDVQTAIQAARKGEWEHVEGVVSSGGIRLEEGEYTITTEVDDSVGDDVAATTLDTGFIVLDLALDDELLAAGYARDVVRRVQDARREADLVITDRIELKISVPADKVGWVETNADFIAEETLATSIKVQAGSDESIGVELTVV